MCTKSSSDSTATTLEATRFSTSHLQSAINSNLRNTSDKMDFHMADDDLDSPRGMTNGQHPAVRCPMRSSTEGAAAPASSQFGWNHAPQFGGQQVPYGHIGMGYYSQPQYWGQGQQNSQGGGQPYHSQQTRSSASPNNSPYGTPERNHGQSQFGHQGMRLLSPQHFRNMS